MPLEGAGDVVVVEPLADVVQVRPVRDAKRIAASAGFVLRGRQQGTGFIR